MEKQYKFNFYNFPVKPDVVAKCLLDIQEKYGTLTPEYVVMEAKNKKHPLHKCFTWKKDEAARKWWVQEARQMINQLMVVQEVGGRVIYTRAFLNIMREDNELTNNPFTANECNYTEIDKVMALPELREYSLKRAYRELDAFKKKYRSLKELAVVIEAIESVQESSYNYQQ